MNKSNKQVGFTLVELLVVISIIAILMAIILGVYLSAKGRRDEKKVLAEIKGIETVIHNFHTDNNFFPPDNFDPGTGSFDPEMNGLYKSLTQDFQEGKKNYLEGAQLKNDGAGNLVAPVSNPDDPAKPNLWRYNSHKPKYNVSRYDLSARVQVGKEVVEVTNWGN